MFYVLGLLLLLAGVFLLVLGSRLYGQPKAGEQMSYYPCRLPLHGEPPQRFYTRLYQALNTSLQDRLADGDGTPVEVVLTGMGFGPHRLFAAPSLFAERPLYLLVRYKHLRCYIYAGQSPRGLFISSWGYNDYQTGPSELERLLPVLRALKYSKRQTLFQYDAARMFVESVQDILCETLDTCLQEKGLKPLEEMEKRPILHAFYQNPFYRDRGLFDFGQDRNDLHTHADLFHNSSRTANPGATASATPVQSTPVQASANSNSSVHHATDMGESDTMPQAHHRANLTAPTHEASGIGVTVADATPPTAPPPPSAAPSGVPPAPQPLFPMDEWLTDARPTIFGRLPTGEDTEDVEDS